jgi:prefoldin beta subunit
VGFKPAYLTLGAKLLVVRGVQRPPPEVEKALARYQELESQLASVMTQKGTVISFIKEIERALSILKDLPNDAVVYRSTGHVLIRVSKEEATRDLESKKEELEIRLTSLEKMESILKKQLEELRATLSKYAKQAQAPQSSEEE